MTGKMPTRRHVLQMPQSKKDMMPFHCFKANYMDGDR